MNPNAKHSISPFNAIRSIVVNRQLIYSLTKREVIGRYRGSAMGLFWSLFNPMMMLAVYTFVFSIVFKARWAGGSDSKTEFALVLFAGLIVFNLFAECINRAPGLILSNVNYVKKIIFPLEILPVVTFCSVAFHFLVSLGVWLIFHLFFFGVLQIEALLLPLVLVPLVLLVLGFSWLFASFGVYLRDISQVIGMITTVLMFLSPIFYPVSALPPEYQRAMQISPLVFVIEQTRNVLIWGMPMDWSLWLIWMIISLFLSWMGFAWFQKTRKGFADVL